MPEMSGTPIAQFFKDILYNNKTGTLGMWCGISFFLELQNELPASSVDSHHGILYKFICLDYFYDKVINCELMTTIFYLCLLEI